MVRVLIGIPAFAGIVPKAQKAFLELLFWCGQHLTDVELAVEIVTKREQYRARNLLISAALAERCDYLLMLDDDMVPEADLLARLLAHHVPVIGALYWQRGGAYHPCIMRDHVLKGDLHKFSFLSPDDPIIANKPGLHQVDVIGGGCILFDMAVFEHLLKPYFWWEAEFGTDISICHRLRDAGIPIHVDTSIEIPHVDEDGQVITRRTIPRHQRQIGLMKEAYWRDLREYVSMTEEALLSAVHEAKGAQSRQGAWEARPRDTWEAVRAFYQEGGLESVLNLAYWNMQDDPARNYVLTEIDRICPKGGRIIDYGCGNGFLSVALAKMGYEVQAMDLGKTPTMAFMEWQVRRLTREVSMGLRTFCTPLPDFDLDPCQDGAIMISVLDHAWDPWGALRWVTSQVKPGGFLILDNYNTTANPSEPQHLCRFDSFTFVRDLEKLGWKSQPESPYLFLKDG